MSLYESLHIAVFHQLSFLHFLNWFLFNNFLVNNND